MTAYRAFGLIVQSPRPIAGVAAADPGARVDVVIEQAAPPPTREIPTGTCLYSTHLTSHGEPYFSVLQTTDDHAYLRCRHTSERGVVTYDLDRQGSKICIRAEREIPAGDVDAYLTGPVFGCVLRLRGEACLHGSAVSIDGRAVALLGAKGAGKSTLTAAFAEVGHAVLTDDIVVIRDGKVESGYPRLRMWPNSEHVLDTLRAATLPPVLSFMEKRALALSASPDAHQWRFQATPLPLAAVCILTADQNGADQPVTGTPRIQQLSQGEAMIALMRNIYAPYVRNTPQDARDMAALGALARQLPVFTVSVSRGRMPLRATREAIVEHLSAAPARAV